MSLNLPYGGNTAFSATLPTLQFAWDSTSLGAFKTCPRYYQYTVINGYVTRAENIHFIFGIGFHAALELYDRLRAEGADHNSALRSAARWTMCEYTWNSERQRPWSSDDPNKNRETLTRAVVWYLDQFQDDPLETIILDNGKPAVELSFRFEPGLVSLTGDDYVLCGHLDRAVNWEEGGGIYIVDRKTTKQTLGKYTQEFFAKYQPDNQMSLYYFAGGFIFEQGIRGIIIDAGQTAATFTRFQRGFTKRTPAQLNEWFTDLGHWLKLAEHYAEQNYWPMNDKSCNNFGGCPFREVCSANPSIRDTLLNGSFHRRVWDPLQTREV